MCLEGWSFKKNDSKGGGGVSPYFRSQEGGGGTSPSEPLRNTNASLFALLIQLQQPKLVKNNAEIDKNRFNSPSKVYQKKLKTLLVGPFQGERIVSEF